MDKFFYGLFAILIIGAGYFNTQGAALLGLDVFLFAPSNAAQKHLEANPPNPHPAVKLAPRDE
jgi:hypothetical protein